MKSTAALAIILALALPGSCSDSQANIAGHVHGPHNGMVASFAGGGLSGHVEIKLHDDKGDLELWLAQDTDFTKPFDLPLTASIELEFHDRDGRKVVLRPRNAEQNEDENGKANVRDGSTNYFIYPSRAGEDAAWLQGKEFHSRVTARWHHDGQQLQSRKLELAPHSH